MALIKNLTNAIHRCGPQCEPSDVQELRGGLIMKINCPVQFARQMDYDLLERAGDPGWPSVDEAVDYIVNESRRLPTYGELYHKEEAQSNDSERT